MGVVRIELDHADYTKLDEEMAKRGYATAITSTDAATKEERRFGLPRGSYWRPEPSDHQQMRIDAHAAVTDLGELGAEIVATSGPSAFEGLEPGDDG